MRRPFFTIGHSTRSADEFLALLRAADATLVADVRTVPRSRHNPQFNRDTAPAWLRRHGVAYEHCPELGGLRGRQRATQPDVNAFWDNASFHNFADYAMSEEFRSGFGRLRALGSTRRVAVMCAEAVWQRCHRRIIADYLIAAGEEVVHILGLGRLEPARITAEARVGPEGALTYPKDGQLRLDL
jgi:uncharacterized protein (DUF488 family)